MDSHLFLSYLFIYLFMAAPGLCCVWAFSTCGKQGYSLVWCMGFSSQYLLWWSMGPKCASVSSSRHMGFAAPQPVGSSWNRDWTCVPCIGRWTLNHWTARKGLISFYGTGLTAWQNFCCHLCTINSIHFELLLEPLALWTCTSLVAVVLVVNC